MPPLDPTHPTEPSSVQLTRREALMALGALALPLPDLGAADGPATPPAQPSPASTPAANAPDLGNFFPLLTWLAEKNAPRLSFLDPRWSRVETWQETARPVFLHHLSYDPPALPMKADLLERDERADLVIERINISATAAYHIPARVIVPKQRHGRLPAVVALHDHSGRYVWGQQKLISLPGDSAELLEFRRNAYSGRAWAEELARRGYVVLVSDAFYFGERRIRPEELAPSIAPSDVRDNLRRLKDLTPASPQFRPTVDSLCSAYEHLTAKSVFAVGATWPGIHVWDDRRTIDYLATRDDVDPTRIGCAGLSLGGIRSAHLMSADPRVKVAVVSGWMTEFAAQLRNHIKSHTWMVYIPGLYSSLDLPDVAALHAPKPLLVQQCLRDTLYPTAGLRGSVDKLGRLYAKADASDRFVGKFYDVPHSFRAEAQADAFNWFDRWL